MADMTMSGAGASRLAFYVPRLGFGLAVIALLMLALAPLGWRTGMWHFRTSFWYFMQPAAYLGIAAGVISLVALFWWPSMGNSGRVMALAGLAVGAAMFYVPWSYYHTLGAVPRIHDITTDTANPPTFSAAVLSARTAEKGNSTDYDQKVAALQKQGYPDLAPIKTALPPDQALPARSPPHRACPAGPSLPTMPRAVASRPISARCSWASPTTSSFASSPTAPVAASMCARKAVRA